MTTEQKAAAYDKAIERTRRMIEDYKNRGLENYIACAKENIDYIFPELKESEGESMKESLIAFFRKYPYSIEDAGINPLDAIAWLEKQCEQKPVGFNIGDEITVNGQVCRVVAVDKPAWSEEDEKIRRSLNTNEIKVGDIITYFRNGEKGIILVSSFDAGIYPRCKWGITDINGAAYGNWAPGSVEYYAATEKEKQLLYNTMPVEVKNWLDSLKPQLLPQQEWSEEDGKNLEKAIWYIEKGGKLIYKKTDKLVSWLKSLKDRHTWKPSDEQMKQLGWIAGKNKDNMIGKELMSLYQDLKKLKE